MDARFIAPAPSLHQLPHETFRERVRVRIEAHIAKAHAEVAAGRRTWSGLERAKKLSVWHAARTWLSGEFGRRVDPRHRVAAATKGRLQAMLEALLEFRRKHRVAREAMSRGVRSVMFRAGTWFAWRFYGAMRVPAINKPLEAPS